MEWKFNQKMKINKFLKIGLLIISTSVFFTACANKSFNNNVKKVEKPKNKTMNDVLKESFEYDANQKLYKYKSIKEENRNNLLSRFGEFCSDKKGKLVYINYYINRNYANSYSNNKAYICEVNNQPYFIGHIANKDSYIYYSVSIDEKTKEKYLNSKSDAPLESNVESPFDSKFEATLPSKENIEDNRKEKQEIQKRERAREQKTKSLFNKKDQRTMTFFDTWNNTGKSTLCPTKCKSINKRSTGYTTLKEATDNNWQVLSKVGETSEAIDDSCTCSGYSVLLKKLSN